MFTKDIFRGIFFSENLKLEKKCVIFGYLKNNVLVKK